MGFGRYADQHKLGPAPLDTRGLRLGRWKLTRYSTGEAELYDLRKDPLELRNVARVPRFATTFQQMKHLYTQYSDCAGDSCRAPIPPSWQLTPAQEQRITDHEVATTNAYYDN